MQRSLLGLWRQRATAVSMLDLLLAQVTPRASADQQTSQVRESADYRPVFRNGVPTLKPPRAIWGWSAGW